MNHGYFGENLTVKGLDESKIYIGSTYQIGKATVRITAPREPCYKLGIRFGTQKVLKQFINATVTGTYVSVLKTGSVKRSDQMILIEERSDQATVLDIHKMIFSLDKSLQLLDTVMTSPFFDDREKSF